MCVQPLPSQSTLRTLCRFFAWHLTISFICFCIILCAFRQYKTLSVRNRQYVRRLLILEDAGSYKQRLIICCDIFDSFSEWVCAWLTCSSFYSSYLWTTSRLINLVLTVVLFRWSVHVVSNSVVNHRLWFLSTSQYPDRFKAPPYCYSLW